VDLNGDGHDDVISGSYWPGHIYVFEGRGKGEFKKGYILCDRDGEKLIASKPWKSEREPDMDSLASAPHLIDFDADGDLDLLVGNIAGRVILIENEGTPQEPKFGKGRTALRAGGRAIAVPHGDAGPTTTDWNGDGLWDLLVGAGDGSVWLYENTGSAAKPEFAAGRQLLEKSDRSALQHDEEPTAHGIRAKVHAVDYNGDGHLDLLVGDFVSIKHAEPKLTDEQREERERLRKERKKHSKELSELYRKYYKDDPEKYKELSKKVSEDYTKTYEKLRGLEARNEPAGFVWVYLQKPGKRTNSARGEQPNTGTDGR